MFVAMKRLRQAAVSGFVVTAVLGCEAFADEVPPPLPAQDFVRPAQMGAIRFSPDGKHFAALAEAKGRMQLVVVDAETRHGGSYGSEMDTDVATFKWLTNDVVAVTTNKRGASQNELRRRDFQTSSISLSGKSRLNASDVYDVVQRVPGSATDLIVARRNAARGQSVWLDVVDSVDGSTKRRLTDDPPGRGIVRWVLDADLAPRAAVGWVGGDERRFEVWLREQPAGPWRMLITYKPESQRGFVPVGVDAQGNLSVLSTLATGRGELRQLDRATGLPGELLIAHPQADIQFRDLIYDDARLDPVGVRVEGDVPQTYWFDTRRDVLQRTIDKSLPADRENRLQFLADGNVLVASRGPSDPGTYYMFDAKARSLTEWSRDRPWLLPERLGVTQPWRFQARDGLEIPGYLTLPRGRAPKSLPLVVWVHGGPHSRDSFRYDPIVQFLANRGYAVLQVNYRGSTGYGDRFMQAGYRQWGLAMQDDLTDAVVKLVGEGRVDPARVCIGGASYGGYAALMGVIREPALFRCAIDYVGVTDLTWTLELPETDYNWYLDANTDRMLKARIGDPDDPLQRAVMDANSPRLQAARIKSPVLLIYGTDDNRVPLRHGTAMREALKAAGASFEWKSFTGEGHGIFNTGNSVELLQLLEAFLARHLGPIAAPAGAVP
jgi:dipeptidyl aminopeptidase/acylaminoacyl peptidase